MNVVLLILITTPLIDMDYQTFDPNRKKYLNLITWDEFKTTY